MLSRRCILRNWGWSASIPESITANLDPSTITLADRLARLVWRDPWPLRICLDTTHSSIPKTDFANAKFASRSNTTDARRIDLEIFLTERFPRRTAAFPADSGQHTTEPATEVERDGYHRLRLLADSAIDPFGMPLVPGNAVLTDRLLGRKYQADEAFREWLLTPDDPLVIGVGDREYQILPGLVGDPQTSRIACNTRANDYEKPTLSANRPGSETHRV